MRFANYIYIIVKIFSENISGLNIYLNFAVISLSKL